MTEVSILLSALDPFVRITAVAVIAIAIYYALVIAFDAWVQSPSKTDHSETQRTLQELEMGYITPDDARHRLRVEVANGEVVFYSTCRVCRRTIIEGHNQLEAWQAYTRHFASLHS
jgi:hypothetical protein